MDSLRCFINEQLDLLKIDEHLTKLLFFDNDTDDADDAEELFEVAVVVVAVVAVETVRPLAVDEAQLDNGVEVSSTAIPLFVSPVAPVARGLVGVAGATLAELPARDPIKVEVMLEVDSEMVSLRSLKSSNFEEATAESFLAGE